MWQDLSETDSIHPCGGHEYILKGSLLLETSQSFRYDTTSSRTSKVFSDIISSSSEESNSPAIRRKNRSWTTFDDLEEYKVYKAKITGEIASEGTHNVSTQTDDNRRVKIDGTREIGHRGPSTMLGSREEASKLSLKLSRPESRIHDRHIGKIPLQGSKPMRTQTYIQFFKQLNQSCTQH